MKYYCAECFEEIGNCQLDCSEAARERIQLGYCQCAAQLPDNNRHPALHERHCPLYAPNPPIYQPLD